MTLHQGHRFWILSIYPTSSQYSSPIISPRCFVMLLISSSSQILKVCLFLFLVSLVVLCQIINRLMRICRALYFSTNARSRSIDSFHIDRQQIFIKLYLQLNANLYPTIPTTPHNTFQSDTFNTTYLYYTLPKIAKHKKIKRYSHRVTSRSSRS